MSTPWLVSLAARLMLNLTAIQVRSRGYSPSIEGETEAQRVQSSVKGQSGAGGGGGFLWEEDKEA